MGGVVRVLAPTNEFFGAFHSSLKFAEFYIATKHCYLKMPTTGRKSTSSSTRDRHNQGKWWLVQEGKNLFIHKSSGPAKANGSLLNNVVSLQASVTKPDAAKVFNQAFNQSKIVLTHCVFSLRFVLCVLNYLIYILDHVSWERKASTI